MNEAALTPPPRPGLALTPPPRPAPAPACNADHRARPSIPSPSQPLTRGANQMTDRAVVNRWLAGYEASWRAPGTEGFAGLFTGDATYLQSPYEQPVTGLLAIR